jgi:hypothetical protein
MPWQRRVGKLVLAFRLSLGGNPALGALAHSKAVFFLDNLQQPQSIPRL